MDLPLNQSAFLWGARQTGKSSYLKQHYKKSMYYDLLDTRQVIRLAKSPYILREEILALSKSKLDVPVIIDEIQKVPELLNEVHWLIENHDTQFILCGSSVRKLKTHATNLLGGRAWKFNFYPLTSSEIPALDLLQALQHGLIPKHYQADSQYLDEYLQAYVDVYLTDEIRNEGLVRNLASFARFLDVAGLSNSELINANNIARNCGIDRTTVQNYYQILVDTLLGYYIYPFSKKVKRDILTATPKFYLLDVGVANCLAQQKVTALKGSLAGRSFEHFILMELMAYLHISRNRKKITYWRTKTGLEVDFVVGQTDAVAIEVKISEKVHRQDLKGLIVFCEEHPGATGIVVSQDTRPRVISISDKTAITILPWENFLIKLWNDEVIV